MTFRSSKSSLANVPIALAGCLVVMLLSCQKSPPSPPPPPAHAAAPLDLRLADTLDTVEGDRVSMLSVTVRAAHAEWATRQRLLGQGEINVGFVEADAAFIPLRHGRIDHVVLVGVLGELPDHPKALRALRDVTRVGGRISISEQLPDPDFVTKRTLRREMRALGFCEEATSGWAFYTSTWVRCAHDEIDVASALAAM